MTTPFARALADLRAAIADAPGSTAVAVAVDALLSRLAEDEVLDALADSAGDALTSLEDALFQLRYRGLERLAGDGLDVTVAQRLGAALAARLEAAPDSAPLRRAAWDWLDLVRRAPYPGLVHGTPRVEPWVATIIRVLEASRFTLGRLFRQRVEVYGTRTLFTVPSAGPKGKHSWLEVGRRSSLIARGLIELLDTRGDGPVALISGNRYELALADLACLTSGIVAAMIPPTTTAEDIAQILREGRAAVAIVSNAQHLGRVDWSTLPDLHTVVVIDRPTTRIPGVRTLAEVEQAGHAVAEARVDARLDGLTLDDLATVMYTSGSTGRPKGIKFDHRCLVSKRFARGVAIPTIDEGGLLLAYLPLCHTFGRYLEMLGAIFWGAQYVFVEDTSIDSMVELFRTYEPTVFISIPLKWVQLYEQIVQRADPAEACFEQLARAVRDVVGARLRVGLSAAGYLDPAIFRFFQAHGVELMSGFGMTEGTGGILMTPPGGYREDTLGVELPAVEARLAADGELQIRGPYITPGYVSPEHDAAAWTEDRWLMSGDIMERDPAGYFRIVDRKKDIFKNVKGETIAPQRIERLFTEIDAVSRFVLIGDHRPYNTGLIVPNLELGEPDIAAMTREERYEFFLNHVVTANRFLAPFERVVDFAVLDRDFTEEHGELTRKGSLRRPTIEDHFAAEIDALYQHGRRVPIPGSPLTLRLPSSLFQALGVTTGGVTLRDGALHVPVADRRLHLDVLDAGVDGLATVRVGSSLYALDGPTLDLGILLHTPALWLGNGELRAFIDVGPRRRYRRQRPPRDLRLIGRAEVCSASEGDRRVLREGLDGGEAGRTELEVAACLFASGAPDLAKDAVAMLERVALEHPGLFAELALSVLRTAPALPCLEVRRAALMVLLQAEHGERAASTLASFRPDVERLLDGQTRSALAARRLPDETLAALVDFAREATSAPPHADGGPRGAAIIELLLAYGAAHPARYRTLRRDLAVIEAFAPDTPEQLAARRARACLAGHFRQWLGAPAHLAVDAETGDEYGWREAVVFDEDLDDAERGVLLDAISHTAVIEETLFLLFEGVRVRLSDIPPGGVWIARVWRGPLRSVYRATVQTRFRGYYPLAIKLDRADRSPACSADEEVWTRVLGDRPGIPIAARQGGHWPERGLWTEQYLGDRRADLRVARLHRHGDLAAAWPFICWNIAHVSFAMWHETGRRFVPGDLSPANFLVPSADHKRGPKLVSLARRRAFAGLEDFVGALDDGFGRRVAADYPEVSPHLDVPTVLSALLDVVGVDQGLALVDAAVWEDDALAGAVSAYAAEVRAGGYIPHPLRFAVERYRAWATLADEPTKEARAATLQELEGTYALREVFAQRADLRVRFFRDTVLSDAPEWARVRLDALIDQLHTGALPPESLTEQVGLIRGAPGACDELEYFLTRLGYPHLSPEDEAAFMSGAGHAAWTDVVVTHEDTTGRIYRVRPPVNPKELSALQRLFLATATEVTFQSHHRFLVAVGERDTLLGGLFYELDADSRVAHLEKIVVAEHSRYLGVGDGLMEELFKRAATAGMSAITVGFYRRGYFYRHGFTVEGRHPGLVKHLE